MYAAVDLTQFQNSEAAIAYRTLGITLVVILEKFPLLHKSQYYMQFNSIRKLHISQFGSSDTLLSNYDSCSTLGVCLLTVLRKS